MGGFIINPYRFQTGLTPVKGTRLTNTSASTNQNLSTLSMTASDATALTHAYAFKPLSTSPITTIQLFEISNATSGTFFALIDGTVPDMDIMYQSDAGSTILSKNGISITMDAWNIILVSFDVGVDVTAWHIAGGTETDLTPSLGAGTSHGMNGGNIARMGARSDQIRDLDGEFGYFLLTDEYIDFDTASNRRKYVNADFTINADGLGTDGSGLTGTQPRVFLANPFGSFEDNLGSDGGSLTVNNGPLTEGTVIDAS